MFIQRRTWGSPAPPLPDIAGSRVPPLADIPNEILPADVFPTDLQRNKPLRKFNNLIIIGTSSIFKIQKDIMVQFYLVISLIFPVIRNINTVF